MGKTVATYLVRVALHQRDDLPSPDDPAVVGVGQFTSESEPPVPTLADLEALLKNALYEGLPYFTDDVIGVKAERVDE